MDEEDERREKLIEGASEVFQVVMLPRKGQMEGRLIGAKGEVLARGLGYADAQFFAEARQLALNLEYELDTVTTALEMLSEYADYVSDAISMAARVVSEGAFQAMLPMTFEKWLGVCRTDDVKENEK